jgi:hypothetical protein
MILLAVVARPCALPSVPSRGRAASTSGLVKGFGTVPQLMFDSDDPAVLEEPIFNDSRVATYADLLTPAIVAKFGRRLAVIDRGHGDPMGLAHIVDVESGALSIPEGAAKLRTWVAEHRPYVTAYVNRSNQPALKAELGTVDPFWWVATLDGTMNVQDSYSSIVQFAGEAAFGLHVDVSVVYHTSWLEFVHQVSVDTVSNLAGDLALLNSTVQSVLASARGL